uniref:CCR4-NOT transcription complex subunit 10 n=1 Tax=Chromera velia CCMP2878 TaxID=1169474 RepID=A0A0G4GRL2_9ALVE|eukprot:Cvel_5099.t1-p1 / transcript=Cvel_5099.t1 / gene=Cvel_5099 / organism=Chromera_velia_CCMP2878 / gene_product=hypothetical protein / transcript_product=hypothetical protein / location=Cvel_scaffold233:27187-37500(+) / protein_length=1738 / sequence_SO=supercontig / SO=protein_coding / is_pseudo=false
MADRDSTQRAETEADVLKNASLSFHSFASGRYLTCAEYLKLLGDQVKALNQETQKQPESAEGVKEESGSQPEKGATAEGNKSSSDSQNSLCLTSPGKKRSYPMEALRIRHNAAINAYFQSGCKNPSRLLSDLCSLSREASILQTKMHAPSAETSPPVPSSGDKRQSTRKGRDGAAAEESSASKSKAGQPQQQPGQSTSQQQAPLIGSAGRRASGAAGDQTAQGASSEIAPNFGGTGTGGGSGSEDRDALLVCDLNIGLLSVQLQMFDQAKAWLQPLVSAEGLSTVLRVKAALLLVEALLALDLPSEASEAFSFLESTAAQAERQEERRRDRISKLLVFSPRGTAQTAVGGGEGGAEGEKGATVSSSSTQPSGSSSSSSSGSSSASSSSSSSSPSSSSRRRALDREVLALPSLAVGSSLRLQEAWSLGMSPSELKLLCLFYKSRVASSLWKLKSAKRAAKAASACLPEIFPSGVLSRQGGDTGGESADLDQRGMGAVAPVLPLGNGLFGPVLRSVPVPGLKEKEKETGKEEEEACGEETKALVASAAARGRRGLVSHLQAMALVVRAHVEFCRLNFRKATKLLTVVQFNFANGQPPGCFKEGGDGDEEPSHPAEDPVSAFCVMNNLGCLHFRMKKFELAAFFFLKALSSVQQSVQCTSSKGRGKPIGPPSRFLNVPQLSLKALPLQSSSSDAHDDDELRQSKGQTQQHHRRIPQLSATSIWIDRTPQILYNLGLQLLLSHRSRSRMAEEGGRGGVASPAPAVEGGVLGDGLRETDRREGGWVDPLIGLIAGWSGPLVSERFSFLGRHGPTSVLVRAFLAFEASARGMMMTRHTGRGKGKRKGGESLGAMGTANLHLLWLRLAECAVGIYLSLSGSSSFSSVDRELEKEKEKGVQGNKGTGVTGSHLTGLNGKIPEASQQGDSMGDGVVLSNGVEERETPLSASNCPPLVNPPAALGANLNSVQQHHAQNAANAGTGVPSQQAHGQGANGITGASHPHAAGAPSSHANPSEGHTAGGAGGGSEEDLEELSGVDLAERLCCQPEEALWYARRCLLNALVMIRDRRSLLDKIQGGSSGSSPEAEENGEGTAASGEKVTGELREKRGRGSTSEGQRDEEREVAGDVTGEKRISTDSKGAKQAASKANSSNSASSSSSSSPSSSFWHWHLSECDDAALLLLSFLGLSQREPAETLLYGGTLLAKYGITQLAEIRLISPRKSSPLLAEIAAQAAAPGAAFLEGFGQTGGGGDGWNGMGGGGDGDRSPEGPESTRGEHEARGSSRPPTVPLDFADIDLTPQAKAEAEGALLQQQHTVVLAVFYVSEALAMTGRFVEARALMRTFTSARPHWSRSTEKEKENEKEKEPSNQGHGKKEKEKAGGKNASQKQSQGQQGDTGDSLNTTQKDHPSPVLVPSHSPIDSTDLSRLDYLMPSQALAQLDAFGFTTSVPLSPLFGNLSPLSAPVQTEKGGRTDSQMSASGGGTTLPSGLLPAAERLPLPALLETARAMLLSEREGSFGESPAAGGGKRDSVSSTTSPPLSGATPSSLPGLWWDHRGAHTHEDPRDGLRDDSPTAVSASGTQMQRKGLRPHPVTGTGGFDLNLADVTSLNAASPQGPYAAAGISPELPLPIPLSPTDEAEKANAEAGGGKGKKTKQGGKKGSASDGGGGAAAATARHGQAPTGLPPSSPAREREKERERSLRLSTPGWAPVPLGPRGSLEEPFRVAFLRHCAGLHARALIMRGAKG